MFLRQVSFIALLIVVCVPAAAHGFSISPARYRLVVSPGTSQTITVQITNTEKITQQFAIAVVGVNQTDSGSLQFLSKIDRAEGWLKCETKIISLSPNKKKSVGCVILVPKDSEAGSHVIALTVTPIKDTKGIGVGGQLAALIVLDVAGEVHEAVSIDAWKAKIVNNSVLETSATVRNNGTITVPLIGKIRLFNWLGREIKSVPFFMGNDFLPDTARNLKSTNTVALLPGFYSAELEVTYGESRAQTTALAHFWFLPAPIKIIFATMFVILAVLILAGQRKK